MQRTDYQTTPLETGTTVYGSDGEKIGDIAEVQNNYFVIEKGFIFTTDIYIPTSAVAGQDDDGVRLSMTKDEIENGDWSNPPVGTDYESGSVGYAGQHTDADTSMNADTSMSGGAYATDSVNGENGYDNDVIERREERLTVDKQAEQAGSVHVGKHVVEQEQSVDVPVTREEVTLERRSVDRPATGDTLTEDAIDVPVYEERVQTGKEARVVEELEVDKTARTDTERVTDTVRREEFDVDDETNRP